jgi:hypothetical protein
VTRHRLAGSKTVSKAGSWQGSWDSRAAIHVIYSMMPRPNKRQTKGTLGERPRSHSSFGEVLLN